MVPNVTKFHCPHSCNALVANALSILRWSPVRSTCFIGQPQGRAGCQKVSVDIGGHDVGGFLEFVRDGLLRQAARDLVREAAMLKGSPIQRSLSCPCITKEKRSWPRPCLPSCRKLVHPSSMGLARELELRRLPVSYTLQPKVALVPRSCRSMQLGPLTMCPGLQCWRRCVRSRRCSLCSHMPANSTSQPAATCGWMTRDAATRYAWQMAASRGTPSCLACTPWPRLSAPGALQAVQHSSGTAPANEDTLAELPQPRWRLTLQNFAPTCFVRGGALPPVRRARHANT